MQKIKNARIYAKCIEALEDDNLELCLQELSMLFPNNQELINQRGRVSALNREKRSGTVSTDEYRLERSKIRVALTDFVMDNILADNGDEIVEGIHNRILIFSPESKVVNWKGMFSAQNFSHAKVIHYGQEIPLDYQKPDVVIFDDTGPNARPHMVQLAKEMPQAHFLYFGDQNPFTETRKRNSEDAAIFERCANANSKFTLHARLRELLDFRKIYGAPAPN